MTRRIVDVCCLVCLVVVAGLFGPPRLRAQSESPLAGVWTLNRSISELPPEIGFNVNWVPPPGTGGGQPGGGSGTGGGGTGGGGRGRRGGGGGGGGGRGSSAPTFGPRESSEDARRAQLLTGEARNPATRLMIVDTPAAVTITNELGQSRIVHPTGKQETIEIQGILFSVTSTRDGDRLVVDYRVDRDREVRYTYSHTASPSQMIVEAQFLEHGNGDKAKLIYEPGVVTETAKPAGAPAPGAPPSGPPASGQPAAGPARESFDQQPGAELKGLKALGILVEDLGPQAITCGLNHDAIESALAKRLTDAGFTVRKNSDEDTYVYVNVMTTSVAMGTCVTRYDAFLYTQATANLSYRDRPVLVQVSLMHRGGIGNSAPSAHAATIQRGLEGYIDLFVMQIKQANK
jgi:hypothetical protein